MKTFYSTDNVEFQYETFGDLLDSLEGETESVIGLEYYSAGVKEVDLSEYLSSDWILESADDYLYDNIQNDDGWDLFQSATKDAKQELRDLLKEWTLKHLSKNIVYKMVGKSTKHTITEDNIWDSI